MLLQKQYFGGFAAAMLNARKGRLGSYGVNCHGLGWEELGGFVHRHPNIVAGDFSGWDGTIRPLYILACHEIISDFYGDHGSQAARIRWGLLYDAAYSYQQAGDRLFATGRGHPSGWFLTTVINTLIHGIIIRWAGVTIGRRSFPVLATYKGFLQHVNYTFYGDDGAGSVSDEAIPYFNMQSIAKFCERIQLKYTDICAGKSEAIRPHLPADELTFLGREFAPWNGCIVGRLPFKTILESLQWQDKKATTEDYQSTCLAAAGEAVYHGRRVYDWITSAISRNYDKAPVFESYDDATAGIMGRRDCLLPQARAAHDWMFTPSRPDKFDQDVSI